ncbi:hypothetical protein HNR60_000115 [Rhodopseudomonas rhenobacensis]|uniref:Uncharacterized protein n=1 Tax=Rhodopseudomonas rhenobacensis TaxID=87461 RepID=A0A7W7YZV2_9BRAD|nr:hypothetical protein [Rhodopseudomonas rhenobacensis]MBB5045386.1 hypothetical protein [Rhodopseudomonas rhenobacensis]
MDIPIGWVGSGGAFSGEADRFAAGKRVKTGVWLREYQTSQAGARV